jgi:hypothetical protein
MNQIEPDYCVVFSNPPTCDESCHSQVQLTASLWRCVQHFGCWYVLWREKRERAFGGGVKGE